MRKRINTIDVKEIVKKEPEEVVTIVDNNSIEQLVIGWNNATEVANEVWREGNFRLLEGDLVMAYRNTGSANSGLYQIVVVKYFYYPENTTKLYDGTYGISVTSSTCSYVLPKVNAEYLKELSDELSKYKIEPDVLNLLRKQLHNEITSN